MNFDTAKENIIKLVDVWAQNRNPFVSLTRSYDFLVRYQVVQFRRTIFLDPGIEMIETIKHYVTINSIRKLTMED